MLLQGLHHWQNPKSKNFDSLCCPALMASCITEEKRSPDQKNKKGRKENSPINTTRWASPSPETAGKTKRTHLTYRLPIP